MADTQTTDPATRQAERPAGSFLLRLAQPVDAASIALFRIGLGVILLVEVVRFYWNTVQESPGGSLRTWIESKYIDPPFHFTYHGFEWVQPLPGVGMYLVFAVIGFCALCIAMGFLYRWAMALLLPAFLYVFLVEKAEYQNHFYFVLLLLAILQFVPADRMWSLSARLHPDRRRDDLPAWCLWALRLQVGIPYFFGGIAKLQYDWLMGQPMQFWMGRMEAFQSIPGWGSWELAAVFSWLGMLFDLLVVPLLLWRRTRPFAFAAAAAFNLMNSMMFHIGIFPWLMLCATTLFFEPDWPRRVFRLPAPKLPKLATAPASVRWVVTVLVAGFAIEMAQPFRHLLYPGNVNWTNEGYHFAWRMMLNRPTPALSILAYDPATRRTQQMDPRGFLTLRQIDVMAHDPEMIREFAVWLKRDLAARDHGDLEIRVVAVCSLNGRRPQRLIDPRVDLGGEPRRWGSHAWIVPLTEPLNPRDPYYLAPQYWSLDPEIAPRLRYDPREDER